MNFSRWSLRCLLAVSTVVLASLPSPAQTLATGDTRTVTEPTFPPVCSTVLSQLAIVSGGPASETTFDTSRIQAALTACPSGKAVELSASGSNYAFLIAPITIPTGVGLIVDGGVTVFASRNPADYQTASSEVCGSYGSSGNGCNNLINLGTNNGTTSGIGIYGYGVIDGRGASTLLKNGVDSGISWWTNSDQANTAGKSQDNPILMKSGHANNFTLYKITLRNSPMFHVGWGGNGFTAWGVKIAAPFTAHNTDGIDPTGTNVTITNASISDGDDNIAVGASSASANVTVTNVNTYSGHGLSVGSYTSGGLTNYLVNNVNLAGTAADGNATGLRLKSAVDRGGLLNTITYENVCIRDTRYPIQLNPFYNTNSGTSIPQFQNIVFQNVHVLAPTGTKYPYQVQLQGYDVNHLTTVTFNNVVFDQLLAANVTPAPQNITIALAGNVYPAFLQTLTGTNVTYTSTATSTATGGVSSCTNPFPYIVGELYLSTSAAGNLQTAAISTSASVTLNAMVEPAMSQTSFSGTVGTWTGVAAPSAAVQFYEGTTQVGTATLSANGTLAPLTLTNLTAGTHTYTAKYPGDSNYSAITFGSATVTATASTTSTTTVLSAPATAVYGTAVTLSATVTGTGGTPTGAVTFYDGSASLGSGALTSGSASVSVTLSGGAHSLTAVYGGDATFLTSTSAAANFTVTTAASTTVVAANPTTVAANATTVLTATISGVSGSPSPTGTVTFLDGTKTLGSASVSTTTGVATFTATMSTAGARTVTANYGGDGNYAVSSGNTSVTVTAVSTTVLTAPSTAVYGAPVSISATVSSTGGSPTGSVTFYDGSTSLSTKTLASGTASASVSLTGGSHALTAVYSGDTIFVTSTSAVSPLTITTATSVTAVTANPTTVSVNGTSTLTATVTGVSGMAVPTGTVSFTDGATALGSGTLNGSGVVTATATLAAPGARTITASYGGDTNYAISSSSTGVQVTSATTTVLTAPATATWGSGVTLSALVNATSGTATGTLSFYDGSTLLGTQQTLVSAAASISGVLLSIGTHNLTAVYTGNATYLTSTSVVSALTVNPITTATTLALSASTVYAGSQVTLTATMTPAVSGQTMTFLNGAAVLGTALTNSSGVATYLFTAGAANSTDALTAGVAAAGNYGGSTSTVQTLTVVSAVAMGATPNPLSIAPGASGMVALTITPGGGFTGSVTVTCTSAVKYVTCATPSTIVNLTGLTPGTASETINVAATTASRQSGPGGGMMFAMIAPFGLLGLVFGSRRRIARLAMLMLVMAGLAAGIMGCGAGNAAPSGTVPTGSQIVTLTATASGVSQTLNVTVNIP